MKLAAALPAQPQEAVLSLQHEDNLQISGSSQRYLMMQKLARKEEEKAAAVAGRPAPAASEPRAVVLLRNMIAPADLDADFEGEVRDECGKFGKVLGSAVRVAVRFSSFFFLPPLGCVSR